MPDAGRALATAELGDLSRAARDRVLEIYEEAFPARERDPFEAVLAASRAGGEIALVALEGDRPIGLAFLRRLEAVGCLLLEYFAVAADRRGAGVGRAFWQTAVSALGERDAGSAIVLEVEDPNEPDIDAAQAEQRARRVRFWEQLGARMLRLECFVVPNLGESGVGAMRLMWIGQASGAGEPSGRSLLELIVAVYEEGYGLAPDHALVERALRVLG
ncbi:MAG TPA: GNAT family N-acetyltransferase [Solirubrobacteraceae bacterium]|nr:GNAT family N-acetyltransferase [Solirubrobacteraceae bacterium]